MHLQLLPLAKSDTPLLNKKSFFSACLLICKSWSSHPSGKEKILRAHLTIVVDKYISKMESLLCCLWRRLWREAVQGSITAPQASWQSHSLTDHLNPYLVSTGNNKSFSLLSAGGDRSFTATGAPEVTQTLGQMQEWIVFFFFCMCLFYATYPEFNLVLDWITTLLICAWICDCDLQV